MTKRQAAYLKWVYLAWTLLSHTVQTADYGWNLAPQTGGEWMCDAQAFINIGIVLWLWRYSKSPDKTTATNEQENELHL